MAELAATALSGTIRQRGDTSCATRAECERRYRAAHPAGKPHNQQLDRLPLLVDWLVRCHRNDGETFLRSQPQIARAWARAGVEWNPTGRPKADHNRFRNNIQRYLGYLKLMGYVADWEPVYEANGEGRGVRITVTADVAQLAIATRRRGRGHGHGDFSSAPPRRRASISRTVSPPSGAGHPSGVLRLKGGLLEKGSNERCVCARSSIDERDAADPPGVGHHESPGAGEAGEGAGAGAARPLPGPVLAAMIEAWRGRCATSPRLDWQRWAPVAERAAARIDRAGSYWGSGVEVAAMLVSDHDGRWPSTLAWFVRKLDSFSKHERHAARHRKGRCGPRCRASKEAVHRQAAYKAAHPELFESVGERLWDAANERRDLDGNDHH